MAKIHPIENLKKRWKQDPRKTRLYLFLRAMVILTLIRQAFRHNYENVGTCIFALVLLVLPHLLSEQLQFQIPTLFENIIYCFIFAAEILGEVNHFYVHIPGWDTMLHTLNGFLCGAIGFSLIYLLNRNSKLVKLSPFYVAFMAFCFSMTVGVCWEFLEFAADTYFGADAQKDFIVRNFNSVTLDPLQDQNVIHVRDITETVIYTESGETYVIEDGYLDIGIIDTMKDLLVNFIGAIVSAGFGYAYLKHEGYKNQKSLWSRISEGLLLRPTTKKNGQEVVELPTPDELSQDSPAPETPTESQ